jgi:hypothetical protein
LIDAGVAEGRRAGRFDEGSRQKAELHQAAGVRFGQVDAVEAAFFSFREFDQSSGLSLRHKYSRYARANHPQAAFRNGGGSAHGKAGSL